MSTGKIVLGTMAGLTLGAIASILFARDKGSTVRKQIMDTGEKLKSKFDDSFDSITDKFKSTKKDTESIVDKGKAAYDDAKKGVKNEAANYKYEGSSNFKHAKS